MYTSPHCVHVMYSMLCNGLLGNEVYVCMCVCIGVCNVCMHICVCGNVCVCMHVCVCECFYVPMSVCACMCAFSLEHMLSQGCWSTSPRRQRPSEPQRNQPTRPVGATLVLNGTIIGNGGGTSGRLVAERAVIGCVVWARPLGNEIMCRDVVAVVWHVRWILRGSLRPKDVVAVADDEVNHLICDVDDNVSGMQPFPATPTASTTMNNSGLH